MESFHKFDLELKSILKEYDSGIDEEYINIRDGKDKAFYKNLQKEYFKGICEAYKIDFDRESAIIISGLNPFYHSVLSTALYLKPLHHIEGFLDYQLEQNGQNAETIIGILEFYALDQIKQNNPFDNSDRINVIRKYIRAFKSKKEKSSGNTPLTKVNKKKHENQSNYKYPVLESTSLGIEYLANLSKRLYKKKYFESSKSFIDVFIKHETCKYLKNEIPFLGMLLRELKTRKYIEVKGLKNSKGIFKIANSFFLDSNGKRFAERAFVNAISRLQKFPVKYEKMETAINTLINDSVLP